MFDWPAKMANRKTLPQKTQEWYDSDAPGETADMLLRDLHMVPENKVPLINLVGDTVLGLIPPADLPDQIQNYIPMPPALARVLAEHLLMLLTQSQVLGQTSGATPAPAAPFPTVPIRTSVPPPTPPSPPAQHQQPGQTAAPVPPSAHIPVAPPPPQHTMPSVPPAAPTQNSWQHVQETPEEKAHVTEQVTVHSPSSTPPPPVAPQQPLTIPHYQKPFTAVPEYRNADLYRKPPQ